MKRPRHTLTIIAFLAFGASFLLLVIPAGGGGDDEQPPDLFVPVEGDDWVDPVESAVRSRLVSVNFDVLEAIDPDLLDGQPAPPVNFNLFEDVVVTVVFDQAEPRWPAEFVEPMEPVGYMWHGSIGAEGDGHVVMITEPGLCAASLHVAGVGWFEVRPLDEGHVVRQIPGGEGWTCGVEGPQGAPIEGGPGQGEDDGGSGCDDGTRIDVIVLYTPDAKDQAALDGKNIEKEIDLAIAEANAAYANSHILTELRLVYKAEIEFDEGTGLYNLPSLMHPWNGELDEVHPLRSALRADLVSLVASQGGSYGYKMTNLSPYFESGAFTVLSWINVEQAPLGFLLPHECGHNMGCAHDRATDRCINCPDCGEPDDCDPTCAWGLFDYSFGYRFSIGQDDYKTIMAKERFVGSYHRPLLKSERHIRRAADGR